MSERLFLRLDDDPLHGPESDLPAGTLSACPVGAPLRSHVAHILLCRETVPAGREIVERVLPDGAVRLIFNFGDAPAAGDQAGHPLVAVGASASPVVVRLRGRVEGFSVTLRPGAAAALLGLPAGELADSAVPGYYDQSHLANEFQALCGLTPTQFLLHATSGSSKTAG